MMIFDLRSRLNGTWAFVLAAVTAPLTLAIPSACGPACGACPVPGGCMVVPGIVAAVLAVYLRAAKKVRPGGGTDM